MKVTYYFEEGCPGCARAERDLPALEETHPVERVQVRSIDGDPGFYLYGEGTPVPVLERRGVPAIAIEDGDEQVVMIGATCARYALVAIRTTQEEAA